jgi:hypothetical protein
VKLFGWTMNSSTFVEYLRPAIDGVIECASVMAGSLVLDDPDVLIMAAEAALVRAAADVLQIDLGQGGDCVSFAQLLVAKDDISHRRALSALQVLSTNAHSSLVRGVTMPLSEAYGSPPGVRCSPLVGGPFFLAFTDDRLAVAGSDVRTMFRNHGVAFSAAGTPASHADTHRVLALPEVERRRFANVVASYVALLQSRMMAVQANTAPEVLWQQLHGRWQPAASNAHAPRAPPLLDHVESIVRNGLWPRIVEPSTPPRRSMGQGDCYVMCVTV